ncbi:MAG TPA: hypothetical protein ENJ48_01765 [Anaerolineae bacterium]|nr:hypothetical protein [Anaerolineae bacterium]
MSFTVLIHIANADPIVADMEELPDTTSSYVTCSNVRARDGKPIHYIDQDAVKFIFPWHRITFIEIFPSDEDETEVETFFRD